MADEVKDVPAEPEYKLYAGETKALKDLVEFPAYVQRVAPKGNIPRIMVIKSAVNSWQRGVKMAALWTENGDQGVNMPEDTQLRVLTGRRGAALREAFVTSQLKKLPDSLPYHEKYLGADPEIFVVDEKGDIIPSWKFLPSKGKGVPIEPYRAAHVYWDGFQAEFTTRPHICMAYFGDDIHNGLRTLLKEAKKYDPKARLSINSVLPVPQETLDTADNEHVEFGCMPSKNAYGLKGNTLPGRRVPLRFAGGHIHLGVKPGLDLEAGVRGMDIVLGVPSVSLFGSFDVPARREYYGQAGEYRLPPHGVEYRTLSNAWLMHPFITHTVFELARVGFDTGTSKLPIFPEGAQEEAVAIIQTTDPERAKAFMMKHKDIYLKLFAHAPPWRNRVEEVYAVWFNGAESVIKEPDNFEVNWQLNGYWRTHSEGDTVTWNKAGDRVHRGEKL